MDAPFIIGLISRLNEGWEKAKVPRQNGLGLKVSTIEHLLKGRTQATIK